MLYEVIKYCRLVDKFVRKHKVGRFEIVDGSISLPFLQEGQYFLVVGSVFNDGLYVYGQDYLHKDETFYGEVVSMAIPFELIELAEEIKNWQNEYGVKNNTPFTSESFNGYSYSKATNSNGTAITWKDAFSARLNVWKRK